MGIPTGQNFRWTGCLHLTARNLADSRFHGTRNKSCSQAQRVGRRPEVIQDRRLIDGTVLVLVRGVLLNAADALNGDAQNVTIDAGTRDGSLYSPRIAAVTDSRELEVEWHFLTVPNAVVVNAFYGNPSVNLEAHPLGFVLLGLGIRIDRGGNDVVGVVGILRLRLNGGRGVGASLGGSAGRRRANQGKDRAKN